jgi:hypothetical protein
MPGEPVDQAADEVDQAADVERCAQELERLAAMIRKRPPITFDSSLTNEIVPVDSPEPWVEYAATGGRTVTVVIEWGPGEW